MKKVLKLSLALLVILMMMIGSTYAVTTNFNVQPTKIEVKKGDEFSIQLSISDLKTDMGVSIFQTTLDYDKSILSLEKMEGLNEWEKPKDGKTYNSETGDIVIERDSLGKNDEAILKLTFKVIDDSKENVIISLKNVGIADGASPMAKTDLLQTNVTIKKEVVNPTPTETDKDKPTIEDPTPAIPDNDKPTTEDPIPANPDNDKPTTENPAPTTPDNDRPTIEQPIPTETDKNDQTIQDIVPTNPDTNKPTQNNPSSNPSKDNTTIPDKDLPKTGESNYILVAFMVMIDVIAVILLINYKKYHK